MRSRATRRGHGVTADFSWLVLACALLTYGTRAGGYLVLARFERIPPRLEAALRAVPAAVMTTLFAPVILTGWREAITLGVAMLAGLRLGLVPVVLIGTGLIVALRHLA